MLGFVRQAGTIADSDLQPIVLPSAPLVAILLLAVRLFDMWFILSKELLINYQYFNL